MLNANHPDDERLSAAAAGDEDVARDPSLATHLADCARCTATVEDLRVLRTSLATLPDLAPPRPLRLLPPMPDAPAEGAAAGWIRRIFAPAMTAGAALALVGMIGTAAPGIGQSAGGRDDAREAAEMPGIETLQTDATDHAFGDGAAAPGAETGSGRETLASAQPLGAGGADAGEDASAGDGGGTLSEDDSVTSAETDPVAARSPWPMVLFTGVTILLATALLRWILVPRAG